MAARRCAIYARISVTSDESVSIDRQIEAAEQYAAARGWQVVAVFRDDGVSATHNKPENRVGWRALLDSSEKFDAVIVWKVDRLARRVLDFLHADEALQARGAGIVCVEQTIDMTTAEGRGFATMLAVFGELEAAAISARVKAARTHLLRSRRVVGGTVPYGWRSVANPDGPGFVLAQDPERIDYVRGMVERVMRGDSIYSAVQWLDEVGAPLPEASQKRRKTNSWSYSTVERLIRNPVLAGMTAFNPGNTSKARGLELLRDTDGLPVVDESVAIMAPAEWRAMIKALDERETPQSRPRALRSRTSALLSGLLVCGEHVDEDGSGTRMHRGNVNNRQGYYCPVCHQAISNFEDFLVEEFLRMKGEHVRWTAVEEVHEGGAALLPEIENRLDELDDLIRQAADRATRQHLQVEQGNLLDLRDKKRAEAPAVTQRWEPAQLFGDDWAEAESVDEKRAVLDDALDRVWVIRGRPGRRSAAGILARLVVEWKMPEHVGSIDTPDDKMLATTDVR